MKLVPLYNKIIVEIIPEETDKRTSSGLFVPTRQYPYYRGKVIGVGKGSYQNAQRVELDVKEGQVILFLKNSGMAVKFDESGNPTQILLDDGNIFAVETEE